MSKDEDRAVFRAEPAERALELVPIGHADDASASIGCPMSITVVVIGSTTLASDLIEAGPNDETPDPGVEPVGIPKRRQVPPGSDEAVLDGVLRQVGIPQDQPRDGVEGARATRPRGR